MLYNSIQWLQHHYPALQVFDSVLVRFSSCSDCITAVFYRTRHDCAYAKGTRCRFEMILSYPTTKQNTPTMGGVLILVSVTFTVLLWGDLHHQSLWVALAVMLSFGGIGALDDSKDTLQQ